MKVFHNPQNQRIDFLDQRFYTTDGETFYPSVTTVLDAYPKPQLTQWVKEVGFNADEIVRRAAEQGSRVHDAIERYLKGEELLWNDEIYSLEEWRMILRFVEFWQTYTPELIACELNIISPKHKLGGTIDLICMIAGQRWLIDVKTSNALYDTYDLQVATYSVMFSGMNPDLPIERRGILWLKAQTRGADKAGKKMQGQGWQVKETEEDVQSLWSDFLHLRAIWDRCNPNYKPKNLSYPDRVKLSTNENYD